MPHQFKITSTDPKTAQTEQVSGEFSDAEWKQLERYLKCSYRLAELGIIQNHVKLRFQAKLGEPAVFTTQLPPDAEIELFLYRLRPFILDKDPTSFVKVRKIIKRRIALPSVRNYLDHLLKLYSGETMPMTIAVGPMALTSDETIRKWLHTYEYHQDVEDKDAELRAMYAVFPEESARAIFLFTLLGRAAAIGRMGALIDNLSKREGIQQAMRA